MKQPNRWVFFFLVQTVGGFKNILYLCGVNQKHKTMDKVTAKKLFKEVTKRKANIERGINYANGTYGLTIDITMNEVEGDVEVAFTESGDATYRELKKSKVAIQAFNDCKIKGHMVYSQNDIIIFQSLWVKDRNNIEHTIQLTGLQLLGKKE